MDDQLELLHRRLERERRARKEAEQIIEAKSRELYLKSQELERTAAAERQARSEAEILRNALKAFTSRLNLDEIVAQLEGFLKSHVACESGATYFFDGESLRLRGVWGAIEGAPTIEMVTPSVRLGGLKQPTDSILVSDATGDQVRNDWGIPDEIGAWLAVPMSAHGRNIGWLTLASRQRDAFNEASATLVQALASEAAIALENARLFQEVERLSTVDPLTGLHNRRHFGAVARSEFARSLRHNLALSAMMIDVDNFKRVNDTYGHAVGDSVLVEVASICMRGIRSSDIHARYGGEEFCLLLPLADVDEACALGERLRAGIAELRFESDGQGFSVTASFGVAGRLAGEDAVEKLIARSDQALYEAKRAGRDRVVRWQPALPSQPTGRVSA